MATAQPLVFRWGIIATGMISQSFVKVSQICKFYMLHHSLNLCDRTSLLILKRTLTLVVFCIRDRWPRDDLWNVCLTWHRRDTHDVIHVVQAVGSRSVDKAQDFITSYAAGDQKIKAYGTYASVYADSVRRSLPFKWCVTDGSTQLSLF